MTCILPTDQVSGLAGRCHTEAIDWAALKHVTDDDIAPYSAVTMPPRHEAVRSQTQGVGHSRRKERLHVRGSLLDAGTSEPERWLTSQSD